MASPIPLKKSSVVDRLFAHQLFESLALNPLSKHAAFSGEQTKSAPLSRMLPMPIVPTPVVSAALALTPAAHLVEAECELAQLCARIKTHDGPFSREELCSLPRNVRDRLVLLWQAVQLDRLAVLGEAEHLFDVAVSAHEKGGKFVVADEVSLLFFDDRDAAFDAAAAVTFRVIGPLGCVAYARVGQALQQMPHVAQWSESADILEQMPQLCKV
jgi:hypothetical protein